MPELPEVETIINDLNKKIVGKRIKRVDVRLKKIVKGSVQKFNKDLVNNSFRKIKRRGKLIIFELEKGDQFLLIHLRMTGQIIYQEKNKIIAGGHSDNQDNFSLPNKYTHVIFYFQDGSTIYFNDQRQFGVLQIVDRAGLAREKEKFGVEPLSDKFKLIDFLELLEGKKTNIKAFLLNQKYIAGIGNIYADEILFMSGVRPSRNINSLTKKEKEKIFKAIKSILKKAIKSRGTTFNNYVDAEGNKGGFLKKLKVYGRQDKPCVNCGKNIKKIKIAGRGTRYCVRCQK